MGNTLKIFIPTFLIIIIVCCAAFLIVSQVVQPASEIGELTQYDGDVSLAASIDGDSATELIDLRYDGWDYYYNAGIFVYDEIYYSTGSNKYIGLPAFIYYVESVDMLWYDKTGCDLTVSFVQVSDSSNKVELPFRVDKSHYQNKEDYLSLPFVTATMEFKDNTKYYLKTEGTFERMSYDRDWSASVTLTLDILPPTISAIVANGGYTNQKVSVSTTDSGSGVKAFYVKTPISGSFTTVSGSTFTIGDAGEGWYEFYAVDNVSHQSDIYKIYYDAAAPTLSSSVSSGGYTNQKVSVVTSDSGSGIKTFHVKTPGANSFTTVSGTSYAIGAAGEGWYELYAVDNAGNESAHYRIYYDVTKPTLSASVANGGYTNKKVSVSTTDSGSGIKTYYVKTPSANSFTTVSGTSYAIGAAGEGWYELYAVDTAGNESAHYKLYYDITKPTLSASVASGGYTKQKLSVSTKDNVSGIKTFYVKTPSATSFSTVSGTSYTIGNNGEGWYELYAVDNAGNESEHYRIYYDVTKPTLSASVSSGGYTNQKVSVSTTDRGSGIKTFYVKTPSANSFTTVSGTSHAIGAAGEGWYELYAVDNAGNESAHYRIYYDVTKPTLSASVANGGYTNQKVSVSTSDSGSGIKTFYVKTPGAKSFTTVSGTSYAIGAAGEGWYELYAVDNAGNESAHYKLYYDVTKPTLSASVSSGGYTNQKVSVSTKDNVSGIKSFYVKTPSANSFTTVSGTSHAIGNNGEGWYELYAVDNAGNESAHYRIYYDVTKPTLSASVSSGGYTNQKVSVSTTDSGSGVKTFYVKTPSANSYTTVSGTSYAIGSAGEGWYELYAVDNAGNESAHYRIYYDVTKPTLNISSANGAVADGGFVNSGVTFTINDVSSIVSSKLYRFENGSWKIVIDDILNDSIYSTNVLYFDSYSAASDRIYYGDRTSAENAIFESLARAIVFGSNYSAEDSNGCTIPESQKHLALVGRDFYKFNYSGVTYIYFSVSDLHEYIRNIAASRITSSSRELYPAADGKYKVTATDGAGNSIEKTFTVDTIVPTVETSGASNSYNDVPIISEASTISIFLTDNLAIDHYDINDTSISVSGTEKTLSFDSIKSFLDEGLNYIGVYDKAGNVKIISLYYDITAPEIQLTSGGKKLSNGAFVSSKIHRTVNIKATEAFIKNITINGTQISTSNTATLTLSNYNDGQYTITVNDIVGHSVSFILKIDSTSPTLSSSIASGGYTNQKVSVSTSDSGSGIKTFYVKTPSATSFSTVSGTSYTIGNNGEGWYELYAVDTAGNESEHYRIYYDVTKPSLSASVSSGGYTNQKVSVSTKDNVSGIKTFYVKTPSANSYTTVSGSTFTIGSAGEGWYELYAVDTAGNESAHYKLYYDVTKPTLSASVANGGYTNQKVSVSTSDSGSGIKTYYVKTPGANSFTTVSGTSYAIGSAGEGWYELYAVDTAGNESAHYKLYYDVTKPQIVITGTNGDVPDGGFVNGGVTFTFSDVGVGTIAKSCLYRYNGTEWIVVLNNIHSDSIYSSNAVFYDSLIDESARVYYGSRSAAENAIFESLAGAIVFGSNYSAEDSESCVMPENQINLALVGKDFYKFTYSGVTYIYFSVSDLHEYIRELASSRITSSSRELYPAEDGIYKVTATDGVGNSIEKTFTVDTTLPTASLVGNLYTYNGLPIIAENHTIALIIDENIALDHYEINGEIFFVTGTQFEISSDEWAFALIEGLNHIDIYDKSQNIITLSLYLDTTAPVVTVFAGGEALSEGTLVSKNVQSSLTVQVSESFMNEILINDSRVSTSRLYNIDIADYADGVLTITVLDAGHNFSEISFVVDNTCPVITFEHATTTRDTFVYANKTVRLGGSADIATIYIKNVSENGDFVEHSLGDSISQLAEYEIYAVDKTGNQSVRYSLLISRIEEFGNIDRVKNSFKTNVFYVVNLPARVFNVQGKDNISGRYSFESYDSAVNWATQKEFEYRVSTVSNGFLYVNASNDTISQVYTDEDSLMLVVEAYAKKYVSSTPVIVDADNRTDFYTIMDADGNADPSALTKQDVGVPNWLPNELSDLPVYLIRKDFTFISPSLDYGTFVGDILFTYLGDSAAAASNVVYTVEYDVAIEPTFEGSLQGFYLVQEKDMCGNEQKYIVYMDFETPTISAEALRGDGSTIKIDISEDWLEENSATTYYLSLDLNLVSDNIDDFYVLTASNGSTVLTCLQGEELPSLSMNTYGSGAWTISVYDRSGNISEFTVYIADVEPYWTYSSLDSIKQVNFHFRTSERYNALTDISIFNVAANGSETELTEDGNGTLISAAITDYTFTVGGKYIARITDMFGRVVELGPIFYTKGLPTGKLSGVRNGNTTNTDVTFVFDDDSYLITYIYDGGNWIEWSESNYQLNFSAATGNWTAIYSATPENCYEYKLFLSDKQDDNLFIEYTFKIDCIMAEYEIVLEDGTKLALSDDMSANQPFYVTWTEDGVRAQYAERSMFTSSYNKGDVFSSDGRYTFYLTDYAGNEATFSVLLDTKVLFSVKANSGNYQLIDGVYYSAYPLTLTVDELYLSFDDSSSNGLPVESGTEITEDGRYEIDVVDYYGNSVHVVIVIDSVPPEYTLVGITNGGTGNQSVTITFGDDVVRAVRVSRSGALIAEIVSGQTFEDEDTYYIQLSDLVGNTSSVTFNIDLSVKYSSGVIDRQVTSSEVSIGVDETGSIMVNDEVRSANKVTLSDVGEYSVILTDSVGNSVSFSFTIIAHSYQNFEYAFEGGTSLVSALKNGQSVDLSLDGGKLVITESGDYEMTLSSPAGMAYILSINVDNIPPEIELVKGDDDSVTLAGISKENITISATKDGEELSCKVGQTFSENGEYVITVTDELGNVSQVTFEIPYRLSTVSIVIIVVGAVAATVFIILFVVKRKIKS